MDTCTSLIYISEKKEFVEHNLGESVVMELCKPLENTNCAIFCDNFFASPLLVKNMRQKYVTGTIRRERKFMPPLLPGKAMKRGEINFHYDKDAVVCQWFITKSVVMAGPNVLQLWQDLMSKGPTPLRQFYDERKVKRQRSVFLVRTSSSLTMPIWEVLTFLIKKQLHTGLIESLPAGGTT